MSWNLPDGCTDADIDRAAGGYDEDEYELVYEDPEDPDLEELEAHWDAADEGDARFTAEYEIPLIPTLHPIGIQVAQLTAPEFNKEVA